MRWERCTQPPLCLLCGSSWTIVREGTGFILTGRSEAVRCADRAALDEACRGRRLPVVHDALLEAL